MNYLKLLFISGFLILIAPASIVGQNAEELEALNTYIDFLNESVHGMVIAHILLVNNNKDINRFIDLDATKTVNISTADLPSNIFDKPDDDSDFYEVSPIELSNLCFQKSSAIKPHLAKDFNKQVENIVSILNKLNQLRFDIEDFINANDLNEKESIYGVYEYLEEAVYLFDSYSSAHNKLASDLNIAYDLSDNDIYRSLKLIHGTSKDILKDLRNENDQRLEGHLTKLNSALLVYESALSNTGVTGPYTRSIRDKVTKTAMLVSELNTNPRVPMENQLYGKHYYYHNQILIKYFNWSGPGFVRDMNSLLRKINLPFVQLDEEPLIFKVIYPIKVEEAKALESKNDTYIRRAGMTSTVEMKLHEEPIETDSRIVVIELFDHNINDRDSVSVSFNGKEILNNFIISRQPEEITVEIEEGKENLLVITAENLGIIPPNTLAVSYRFQGKRKRILLENDLGVSEAIEVKLVKPDN